MFFGDIMLIVNKVIWGFAFFLIVYFGIYFSFKLRGIQFRFFSMFKSFNREELGLFFTSLAGRIGVGSIAGVALSIYVGGVGSIFWMWISTFLCAVITYVEVVLGVKYKVNIYGEFFGGPSYYIRDGIGCKSIGFLFSFLIIICYIFCFLSIQSNTIVHSIVSIIPFSPIVIGICISVICFFCIYGGFKSVVDVSSKLVPLMGVVYIGCSIIVLILNFSSFFDVVFGIFKSAFNFKSVSGGFIYSIIIGVQRGIFSNESGIGTSSIVASSSDSNDFKSLGFVQMFGVYVTSFLFCTATAIILLNSPYNNLFLTDINGIELMNFAFRYHFGSFGSYILLFSIVLFSFSTITTGYFYGESCFSFFSFDKHFLFILRGVTLIILFLGGILSSNFLWAIVDIFVGVLIIINLIAMWFLRNDV